MMDQDNGLISVILFFFVVFGLLYLSITAMNNIPCEEFGNTTVKNLPVRCLEYYGKTK